MKHHAFGTVVNGEACLNLINDLRGMEAHIFMEKHKIAATTYKAISDTLQKCWNDGIAYTFMADVARVMKEYNFEVTEPAAGPCPHESPILYIRIGKPHYESNRLGGLYHRNRAGLLHITILPPVATD